MTAALNLKRGSARLLRLQVGLNVFVVAFAILIQSWFSIACAVASGFSLGITYRSWRGVRAALPVDPFPRAQIADRR